MAEANVSFEAAGEAPMEVDSSKLCSNTVIIAVDNSAHSEYAFDWFVENSLLATQRIVITHCPDLVSSMKTPRLLSGPEFYAETLREENIQIRHIEEKYRQKMTKLGLNGDFVVFAGKVGEAIIHAARSHNASLIVVGSKGTGRVKRTLLSSVSDYVLGHSAFPVLVCRRKRQLEDVTIKKQNTEEHTPQKSSLREKILRRYHSVDDHIRNFRSSHERKKAAKDESKQKEDGGKGKEKESDERENIEKGSGENIEKGEDVKKTDIECQTAEVSASE